jgi:Na+/H+ antiporter NhaD/arsenite permease-like protein
MLATLIVIAAILVIMGILILVGKGDNLIAGYNTASKEEREQYDIKRLRGLIGGCMLVLAPMLFLLAGEPALDSMFAFAALTIILCAVVLALANTWAKKKK